MLSSGCFIEFQKPLYSVFTGMATTGLNFAVMLAQQGQRVLLLDADLRRPSLHKALDILREAGFASWSEFKPDVFVYEMVL